MSLPSVSADLHSACFMLEREFATNSVLGAHVGRLHLADGTTARLVVLTDGLHIIVAPDSKAVHYIEESGWPPIDVVKP